MEQVTRENQRKRNQAIGQNGNTGEHYEKEAKNMSMTIRGQQFIGEKILYGDRIKYERCTFIRCDFTPILEKDKEILNPFHYFDLCDFIEKNPLNTNAEEIKEHNNEVIKSQINWPAKDGDKRYAWALDTSIGYSKIGYPIKVIDCEYDSGDSSGCSLTKEGAIKLYHKTKLMADMQMFADIHNKYFDDNGLLVLGAHSMNLGYGIEITDGADEKVVVSGFNYDDTVFRIYCYSSEHAEKMLEEFGERIEQYYL